MATLTREQAAQYAYAAGFRGNDLVTAVAIAGRESGYRTDAHRTDAPASQLSGDRGLWQINYVNDPGLMQAGIIQTRADLFDPLKNAKAAYYLYHRSNNTFAPWTAGPGGWTAGGSPTYGTDVGAARTAVDNAAKGGLFGKLPDLGDILGTVTNPLGAIPGFPDIPNPLDVAKGMADFATALLRKDTWIRVAQVLGGSVLVAIGLGVMIGRENITRGAMAVGTDGASEAMRAAEA